jgi:hypothetical protein
MDPKMDSGYQNLTNLLSQYNINSDLSYNNVLAILDKLFCLQVTKRYYCCTILIFFL